MNQTKLYVIAFISICSTSFGAAQTIDCKTDFWTINFDGVIQQWSLNNNTISGGDTVLSGGGVSLSYCGDEDAPTFFSNNSNAPYTGFTYYHSDSGWVNVSPTYLQVDNNGGHLNDQYYMIEGGFIQIVKYWDGMNLVTVDSLHKHGEFFAVVQDIAVDTSGHAWIFTGSLPSAVDSLKVYDPNGRINSYDFQFNKIAYGSFFLNDTLYIGTYLDTIFPVLINGGSAQLGNPIAFPSNSFTDMASCQKSGSTTSISEYSSSTIKVFPNPTDGDFFIDLRENNQDVIITVTDLNGREIHSNKHTGGKLLKIRVGAAAGVYFLMVEDADKKSVFKIIKD